MAIKVLEKESIKNEKQVSRIQREIRFLKLLNHPNIVRVYEVVETPDAIYIVMEYIMGGELFDYIVVNKRVKEREARYFFRQVLSAVDYCHQVNPFNIVNTSLIGIILELCYTQRSETREFVVG